jgi:tetratricopeptide (TPR) repeat protein
VSHGRAREDPGLFVARRSLAMAYGSAGQYAKAVAELRRLAKETALSAEDEVVLGDNLRFAGRLDEAVTVLRETARKNPRFPQPWISLGEVHIKEGRLAEARTAFAHVLEIAPDHVEALRGLGDLAILEQNPDEAGRRYARILEVEPGDAGAMTKLGVVRMRTGSRTRRCALPPGDRREPKTSAPLPGRRPRLDRPSADQPFDGASTPGSATMTLSLALAAGGGGRRDHQPPPVIASTLSGRGGALRDRSGGPSD